MTRVRKLLDRFLLRPKDFTFSELKTLLADFGYHEAKAGKTSGSRVAFYNGEIDDLIRLHRPHPSSVVKRCYLDEIRVHLKDRGLIK
ncbi:MAG: type II toxin-antitoxin system HicA family toxin [Syntrophorhabdales bacterium]|jgi:hypothetical protein